MFRVDISANAFVLLDPLLLGIFCDSICHSRETGGVTDKEIFVFDIGSKLIDSCPACLLPSLYDTAGCAEDQGGHGNYCGES